MGHRCKRRELIVLVSVEEGVEEAEVLLGGTEVEGVVEEQATKTQEISKLGVRDQYPQDLENEGKYTRARSGGHGQPNTQLPLQGNHPQV